MGVNENEVTDPTAEFEVAKGRRMVTFAIDRSERGDADFRVELLTPAASKAKFQPEGEQ